ncbi:metallo-beta-lactamase [Klebsiella variicola]|uniref:Metallo-beta-lactamase n=1 Tax=Klebsiella variicola TaxID=244366 RepID=A0A7H4MLH4_KLEVA|nr:metallo-beta-lactamase [Klebsiella variicola]
MVRRRSPGSTRALCPAIRPAIPGIVSRRAIPRCSSGGDIVHFPTIQTTRTSVSVAFDVDPEQARQTRECLLRQAASEQWLIAGMHLGLPGFARVVETPSGYLLQSV